MADSQNITDNLLEMYGRNDWIMRANFRRFIVRSGIDALPRQSRILDCGCAMGHFIGQLRDIGFSAVTGLDASPEMARTTEAHTGAPTLLMDAAALGEELEPACFDVVIASDLMHHFHNTADWRRFLDGVRHVLAPGGRLVIRDLWPAWPLRLLMAMARCPALFVGPLKARLQSFVDEKDLVANYLAHWPSSYREWLAGSGLEVEREADWLMHRITVARPKKSAP